MAKIAPHLNHLIHREPVSRRECAREHRIFPSLSAQMGSRDCRRRSVTAVAWSTSELCELMLSKPIVHRMRLQRLGDRGWKNRRPLVAEMAGDASVGDGDLGDPNLPDAGAELVRFFDFTVVAE